MTTKLVELESYTVLRLFSNYGRLSIENTRILKSCDSLNEVPYTLLEAQLLIRSLDDLKPCWRCGMIPWTSEENPKYVL